MTGVSEDVTAGHGIGRIYNLRTVRAATHCDFSLCIGSLQATLCNSHLMLVAMTSCLTCADYAMMKPAES